MSSNTALLDSSVIIMKELLRDFKTKMCRLLKPEYRLYGSARRADDDVAMTWWLEVVKIDSQQSLMLEERMMRVQEILGWKEKSRLFYVMLYDGGYLRTSAERTYDWLQQDSLE